MPLILKGWNTEIADAISSLKNGKSSGVDQLFAEHVKNADKSVTVLASLMQCTVSIIVQQIIWP